MSRRLASALAVALTLSVPAAARAQDEEVKKLDREADAIAKIVEEIRGLKFKGPVKKGIQSRDELRKFVLEELSKEMPDEKIRAIEKAYIRLGFLKPGTDLKKVLVDLYTEQIAGFYNPERKELFLITHGGPEQNMLMAHELTHALQDQNFDLLPLQKSIVDNDDRSLALTSVIEGEATVVMVAYMLKEQGIPLDVKVLPDIGNILKMSTKFGSMMGGDDKSMEVMKNAPKVLTENLMFGYVEGASFCQRLVKQRSGWEGVSALYKDLPQSSEQILHPEKFSGKDRDEPIEVVMPDLAAELGRGWKLLLKNVMGEFNTVLLFKEKLPEGRAEQAGAGWGGDAWQALEGPQGEVVLAWYSVWDTPKDAEEFAATYKAFAEKRGGDGKLEVEVRGRAVAIVDGHRDQGALDKLTGAFERKVEERRGYGGAKAATAAATPAAGGNPFASLKLPDGYTSVETDDPAVKLKARGPGGVEVTVIESEAAARRPQAAARRAAARLKRDGWEAEVHEGALTVGGQEAARLSGRKGDRGAQHYYVASGEKQYVLRVEYDRSAGAGVLEAFGRVNPGLVGGEKPAARPRERDRKREPQLY